MCLFSGGLPPAESPVPKSKDDIIQLPETATILDLLLSFARRQRYPDLHNKNIDTLVSLADAAEKYEVYAAVMALKVTMRVMIEQHPLQVFRYAGTYDYVDLLDDAAPFVLGTPLLDLYDLRMPENCFRAWLCYLKALEAIREQWIRIATEAITRRCDRNGCGYQLRSFVNNLAVQIQEKTFFLDLSHSICGDCGKSMRFGNPFATQVVGFRRGPPEPTPGFTSKNINAVFADFPPFSRFL